LRSVTFDKFKNPHTPTPVSAKEKLPHVLFCDQKHNHAPELCALFHKCIIDHLEDLHFVSLSKEGRSVNDFVDKELWACEVDAELIKLQSWPIVMNDIDILLKDDEWLNDNIINAILFMANVGLHEVTKLYGGLSPNPLSTHVVLPTFALSTLYFNHSKGECNQFVKLIQDKKKNSDELKRLNFHPSNFKLQCEIWYATQSFGFMARVLQHCKSKNLTPSHITCVFNRDADFHWVAYDIDISQNIIYEYDPMAFGDPKIHELTPWLAKFLGIYKYQLKSYHGPIYFGPDDMVLTNKHKSD
jgi:hypothetical protein